jgi:hypothetical protein
MDRGDEEGKIDTLHVQMVVSNNDTEGGAWSLDTRSLQVQFPGHPGIGPVFIKAPAAGLPVVSIPPGEQRTLDLYYPLPPGIEGAREIPNFDLTWQVQTSTQLVAERTPFERMIIEPNVYTTATFGVGGGWWHDPFYASYGYWGPRAVIIQRGPVIYRQRPYYRRYYHGFPRR